jgi:uncharacterized protein
MQYRQFGKLNWKGSALGFGCMRLPVIDGDYNKIDEPEAIRMLRHAIDHGVNYVDSAYGYHGGNSEVVLGKALLDGYRAKVHLATKLPVWHVKEYSDFDRLLNEQRGRLQVDTIDVYLLHALGAESWHKVRDLGVLKWAEGALADGRIGCLGFSFHDNYDAFKEIVDAYDKWAMCQIQYNYMDIENQAGTKGLQYAGSKGLAVVIMEGLLGGKLTNPPDAVKELWSNAPRQRSAAEWALQWLWNQPEVSVVLSGMSTMEQVQQNLESAGRAQVGGLTAGELALVDKARETYKALCPIPCTNCKYCMPCPNGVNIPDNFSRYNDGVMFNSVAQACEEYKDWTAAERADQCIQCRECEDKCPQKIEISEWMQVVHGVLGEGKPVVCQLP